MKQQSKSSKITVGVDSGDRRHRFCALDGKGEVVEEGTIANERRALTKLTLRYRGALAIMEAGAHSPWISRSNTLRGRALLGFSRRRRLARISLGNHTTQGGLTRLCSEPLVALMSGLRGFPQPRALSPAVADLVSR